MRAVSIMAHALYTQSMYGFGLSICQDVCTLALQDHSEIINDAYLNGQKPSSIAVEKMIEDFGFTMDSHFILKRFLTALQIKQSNLCI